MLKSKNLLPLNCIHTNTVYSKIYIHIHLSLQFVCVSIYFIVNLVNKTKYIGIILSLIRYSIILLLTPFQCEQHLNCLSLFTSISLLDFDNIFRVYWPNSIGLGTWNYKKSSKLLCSGILYFIAVWNVFRTFCATL